MLLAGSYRRGACRDIPLRMVATAALVVALTGASELLGPLIGGALAALPILASVLAVFTHRDEGPSATIALLRGMLTGMPCFVAFCAVIALMVVPVGVPVAFAAAATVAVALQATAIVVPHIERIGGARRAMRPRFSVGEGPGS